MNFQWIEEPPARDLNAERLQWILKQGSVDCDGCWSVWITFPATALVAAGVVGAIDIALAGKLP